MAEIQMEYSVIRCQFNQPEVCRACGTMWAANNPPCAFYLSKHEGNVVPFGNCDRSYYETKYKGLTTKTYEIELDTDDYNPHLNCMRVFVRGNWYDCSKVILDGVCIYGEETKDG